MNFMHEKRNFRDNNQQIYIKTKNKDSIDFLSNLLDIKDKYIYKIDSMKFY